MEFSFIWKNGLRWRLRREPRTMSFSGRRMGVMDWPEEEKERAKVFIFKLWDFRRAFGLEQTGPCVNRFRALFEDRKKASH
jgi:hypothetical protein